MNENRCSSARCRRTALRVGASKPIRVPATVTKRTAFSYGLNVFLTIITFGPGKVILVHPGGRSGVKRRTITVDEFGNAAHVYPGSLIE